MNAPENKKMRWPKKLFSGLGFFLALSPVLLFVLWGLWPMLVPRWGQDQCSFGEVSNERYWQMRQEVREDTQKALPEMRLVLAKTHKELRKLYPADLSLLKRWNRHHSSDELIKYYPQHNDIQRVILTSLVLKHAKRSKTENEELAYMHAIMREMGGWFTKSSRFKHNNESKHSYHYSYIFPFSYFIHDLLLWPLTLIVRYTFIGSTFQISQTHGQVEYSDTGYQPTNPIDGLYYTTAFPNGGCPTIISKNIGEK